MSKFQPIRGTQDIYGEEGSKFHRVLAAAGKLAALYNYQSLTLPIFESTEVFARSLGETSDVVSKEMFSFQTKGEENVTLRPEFTAGVVRALISNGMQQSLPLKFFSYGPVFRYERPQKGRYRQFHQVNFEYFGNADALADAEAITLAAQLISELKIENVKLNINTLGDKDSRKAYTEALVKYLKGHEANLSEDSKKRLELNPLRVLDSKDEGDKKIVAGAPVMQDYLNETSKHFFQTVLKNLEIPQEVIVNPRIVRGLDYYNHTVFEFIAESENLGTQNTILAGGRYDGLVGQMGGGDVPAIGFAAGIERLMMMLPDSTSDKRLVAIISDNNEKALAVATTLRQKNITSEVIYSGNFKKKVQKADKISASHIVFVFEDGVEVKNMKTGEQQKISDVNNYEF
jgi:histidyl-tRNA synthetase